ncbi:MAG: glycosyltransferase family 39 protein [bacterium]
MDRQPNAEVVLAPALRRRREWLVNLSALIAACGVAAGLLGVRNAARRKDGGLTLTAYDVDTPGPSSRALQRRVVPTVDTDARQGPHAGARVRNVRYDGWIWVPFRGHFVLALSVRGTAQLTVGAVPPIRARSGPTTTEHGHRVHSRRLVKEQRLLGRGWHPLTLQATLPPRDGSLRLFWMPPGRRGVPEYVEPAMLRPAGTKPTSPGHAGPAPRDGWIASALLALLASLLMVWGRRPLRRWITSLRDNPERRQDALSILALVCVALAVRLWDLGGAGQTWDEDVYFGAGRNQWLNLLGLDFRALSWQWNLEHPPVTRYLLGFGALFSEDLAGARKVSALLGALVPAVVYLAGRDLFADRRVGIAGALVAVTLPALLAHSKVAGHESASVLLYTLTCYAMIRALRSERSDAFVAGAIFGGLAVGCRLVNLTAWLFVLALAVWIALPRWRQKRPLPLAMLLMPVIAGALFVLIWPRLWSSPARHLGELLTYWHPDVAHHELFIGREIRVHHGYFPVYVLVTTPTVVLAGVALFLVRLGWHRGRAELALGLWALAPLLVSPLVPFHRDGVRYVLPILAPLALMAGAGGVWLMDTASSRLGHWRPRRWLAGGVAALLLAGITALASARVHPYYLDFYNDLSGGPEAALKERRYEFSWWGEGLGGAVRYLRRHATPHSTVGMDVPARHTVVLHPDIRTTYPGAQPPPDFLVFAGDGLRRLWDRRHRRWRHPPGYRVVHEERVEGVPLVRVYRRR